MFAQVLDASHSHKVLFVLLQQPPVKLFSLRSVTPRRGRSMDLAKKLNLESGGAQRERGWKSITAFFSFLFFPLHNLERKQKTLRHPVLICLENIFFFFLPIFRPYAVVWYTVYAVCQPLQPNEDQRTVFSQLNPNKM